MPSRRLFSASLTASRLGRLMLVAWILASCRPATDPPPQEISRGPHSLVLITLDTTRADRLQPYDGQHVTPHLQQLADDGIVMEQAFAVSPVTMPTHATLLTGLYPPQHGVRTNGRHRLADEFDTLAEHFARRGDRTAAFVSAAVLERRYGLDQGFEVYDDDLSNGKPSEARMITERPAAATVDRARRWLDALDDGERFFLWVHLFDPHASYTPPSPYREQFADQPYDGEIRYMDSQIGRLMEHPRLASEQPLAVSLIADHGESLGEHGEATHGLLAYDATLRIPWILRLPNGPRGLRWRQPVSQVDLLPTLLDAQGIAVDADTVSGRSLLPFDAAADDDRVLYGESMDPLFLYGWQPLAVTRQGPWKYIDAPTPELYHVVDDPDETTNLVADERSTVRRLAQQVPLFRQQTPRQSASQLPLDDATRAKLESLGYTATTATDSRRLDELSDRLDPKAVIDIHHTMQQAEGLMAEGRSDTAARLLHDILQRDPRNHQALLHGSRLRFESGDLDGAAQLLEEGLTYYPGEVSMTLSLAAMEGRRGRHGRAVELGMQAIDSDPQQVESWLVTAEHLLAAGQTDELTDLYELAFERFVDDAALHVPMGQLMARADHPQAEVALLRAASSGDHPDVHRALAQLYAAQGRDDEAAQQRRLAGIEGAGTDANGQAEALAQQGRIEEAEAIWQRLLTETPEDAAPYGNLATLALQRGDWEAARRLARKAVDLDADLAPSWNALAYALEELGEPDEAARAYEQALQADPSYVTARFNLGLLYKRQQAFRPAADVFETLVRSQPDHWNAHFELILLYAGPLGDPARARPHVLRNLEAQPDHPKAPLLRELLTRIDGALNGGP